jgi:hypothetical protein
VFLHLHLLFPFSFLRINGFLISVSRSSQYWIFSREDPRNGFHPFFSSITYWNKSKI